MEENDIRFSIFLLMVNKVLLHIAFSWCVKACVCGHEPISYYLNQLLQMTEGKREELPTVLIISCSLSPFHHLRCCAATKSFKGNPRFVCVFVDFSHFVGSNHLYWA